MQSFLSSIDAMNAAAGDEREKIEARMWATYGVDKAILALDMSQFSLSVRRSGILSYLGLIRRMHLLTGPIVAACGGEVVKYVADNMMAVFADSNDAIAAAVDINRSLRASPIQSGPHELSVAIGIDYGRFVLIPRQDCFGDPVNVAYKLGEDLARPGEILITDAARAQLAAAFPHRLSEQQVSLSGLLIAAHRVEY